MTGGKGQRKKKRDNVLYVIWKTIKSMSVSDEASVLSILKHTKKLFTLPKKDLENEDQTAMNTARSFFNQIVAIAKQPVEIGLEGGADGLEIAKNFSSDVYTAVNSLAKILRTEEKRANRKLHQMRYIWEELD